MIEAETEFFSQKMVDHGPATGSVLTEVLMGLSQTQKSLPAKLLYDKKGSEIFEDICNVPSYYPTRTEKMILSENAHEIASYIGENALIIEPGSGAALKVRILLDKLPGKKQYVPLEISKEILLRTSRELLDEYDDLDIYPVCADFTRDLVIPKSVNELPGKKVVFFPGSTIGNLDPEEARGFLRKCSRLAGPGGGVLIGVDTKKDREILRLAYNDPEGVTAAFNLNLLHRLNREIDASFDPSQFRHEAIYNEKLGRIEMHLVSLVPQLVRVHQTVFRFRKGESIHTENSYKYSVEEFTSLAGHAGLTLLKSWQDPRSLFSVYYFESL